MTQETRETLTLMARYHENEAGICRPPLAQWHQQRLAALRDVLTPRTCGNCRHIVERGTDRPRCGNPLSPAWCADFVQINDGCLLGWQAREGETS